MSEPAIDYELLQRLTAEIDATVYPAELDYIDDVAGTDVAINTLQELLKFYSMRFGQLAGQRPGQNGCGEYEYVDDCDCDCDGCHCDEFDEDDFEFGDDLSLDQFGDGYKD